LAWAPAHAQDAAPVAADANDSAIGDIIVTAQKRSQSISDVGLTITALGADTLQKQGIKSLNDLAQTVPGLSYAPTHLPGIDQILSAKD
jgi:iron complex outermembrane receptor protein